MHEPFQIFVKPAGPVCNLACGYCYYLDKKSLYPAAGSFRMNEQVLENYILQHIEASCESTIMFSWHGGEPMLAGIDFFREAVRLQKKYRPPGAVILNGIQTNGTLIDDEWCRLFPSRSEPPCFSGQHSQTVSLPIIGYQVPSRYKAFLES